MTLQLGLTLIRTTTHDQSVSPSHTWFNVMDLEIPQSDWIRNRRQQWNESVTHYSAQVVTLYMNTKSVCVIIRWQTSQYDDGRLTAVVITQTVNEYWSLLASNKLSKHQYTSQFVTCTSPLFRRNSVLVNQRRSNIKLASIVKSRVSEQWRKAAGVSTPRAEGTGLNTNMYTKQICFTCAHYKEITCNN